MADDANNWEYGTNTQEITSTENLSSAVIGENGFFYELSGSNWGKLPKGCVYKEATSVAVNSKDNVYVYNRGTIPMIVFNKDGDVLDTWENMEVKAAHGVSIGPDDEVYCVDVGDNTVKKFSSEGKLLMTLGTSGQKSPKLSGLPFSSPTDVAVDRRNGDIYISDGYGNARVHKYSSNGKLILSWGESGTGPGQFNIVHNIAVDSQGWVYIADRENQRVQVFNDNGKYETQWVNMSKAATICTDNFSNNGLVYVGEYFCGIASNDIGTDLGPRISIMTAKGELLARIGRESYGDESGRFYAPHGIAIDSNGDIYVAEVSWSEFGINLEPQRELRSMQKLVRTEKN
ncbi:MAG: peptidyl-alpha-hydroxyglycine alpha-amidating lyase family protein [Dehalococcoidia bacterium]